MMQNDEDNMLQNRPFFEHLQELKRRLTYVIICFLVFFGIAYANIEMIYDFLLKPLKESYEAINGAGTHKMIYTGLTEAFFTYLKLAIFTSCCISLPFALIQIYCFISPGLYLKEKKALLPYFIATPILFLSGAIMVYYYIFPLAWQFFISFENSSNLQNQLSNLAQIKLEPRVSEYLSLVMQLIFAFGLAFQLPIILTILVRLAIIDVAWLKKMRKFAIVIIFFIAAFLTPPDIVSQIGLAIPMMLLYELSIIISKFTEKSKG